MPESPQGYNNEQLTGCFEEKEVESTIPNNDLVEETYEGTYKDVNHSYI